MTTQFIIEVTDDNAFNTGWLGFLLGFARPDPDADPFGADGWDMAKETPTLKGLRAVFDPENTNFKVTLKAPKPQAPREVIAREPASVPPEALLTEAMPESEARALEGDR